MNKRKEKNSAILLADGIEIGRQGGGMSYEEMSGVLGLLLATIRSHRTGWLEAKPENRNLPIPAVPQVAIQAALEGRIALNAAAALREASAEDADDEKDGSGNSNRAPKRMKKREFASADGTEDVIVVDDGMKVEYDDGEAEFDW